MNWIYYLLEANLYLTVFYALYYLILKNETYYQLNRAYLLLTSLLAFLIPFLQLGFLKPVHETVAPVIAPAQQQVIVTLLPPVHQASWGPADYVLTAYISVSCILAIHLFIKIYSLIRLSYQNKITVNNFYKLIEIGSGANAFSFFHYLFISIDQPQKQTVINHELIHIQQKHSWDILYLQILKIVNWFNPVVYLLQHSIKEQHEFIADRETSAREENTSAYATFLLNNIYGFGQSGLTNTFFNKSLLKKRIIMLHQKPSGNLARLKYLAALPVCAALLCISTLGFSKTYALIDLMPQKADTVLLVPPPPPEQPDLKHVVKFRPPTPPFGSITKKGYRYAESGYLIDGKWYSSVIIQQSKNVQTEYWKNKVSPAEVKMLHDKYGYTFPSMPRHAKLPPPPQKPKVIDVALLPPPPAPSMVALTPLVKPKSARTTKGTARIVAMPTVSPESKVPQVPAVKVFDIKLSPKPPATTANDYSKTGTKTNKIGNEQTKESIGFPLVLVNGEKYIFKEKRKAGQQVICSATDSIHAYVADDVNTQRTWGEEGRYGVVLLYGKNTSVIVK